MSGFNPLGKLLIIAGFFVMIVGLLLTFWEKVPLLGRLPGDIFVQRDGFKFFFPVVTSLVLSVILSIVLNIILRLFRR